MGKTTIKLSEVRQVSSSRPGMMADFVRAGKIKGEGLELSREDFDRLQAKWFPGLALGTLIHEALAPVVKVLDMALGTDLANCGGCAGRQMKLNAATQSKAHE